MKLSDAINQTEAILAGHPAGLAIIQVACEAAHSSGPVSVLCGYAVALAELIGGKKIADAAPKTVAKTHASIRETLKNHPSASRIFAELPAEAEGSLLELAVWTLRMSQTVTGSSALRSGTTGAPTASPINSTAARLDELRDRAAAENDLGKRAVMLREIRTLRDGGDWLAPQPDEPRRQKPRRDQ